MPDTKEGQEVEIAALAADAQRTIIEGKHRLSGLSARLADLKHRLAKFEPSTREQKEKHDDRDDSEATIDPRRWLG
jgi:hypothetical protein